MSRSEPVLGRNFLIIFVAINLAGFILGSYWLFVSTLFATAVLLTLPTPVNRLALFTFLLPLMPMLNYQLQIAGIPVIPLSWPRLLILIILVPLLFQSSALPKSRLIFSADKYVILFALVTAFLSFRGVSFTAGIRSSLVVFIDIMVPYLAFSRYLSSPDEVRRVLFSLLAALIFVGFMNVFETARSWHLYHELIVNLTGYLDSFSEMRIGMLRAYGPLDKPSASAFALAAGLGVFWFLLRDFNSSRVALIAGAGALCLGLFCTFSRGSWLAAGIIILAFVMTTSKRPGRLAGIVGVAAIGAIVLLTTEIGTQILTILPVVGDSGGEAARTVDYRSSLFSVGIEVANENPWFGDHEFYLNPLLLSLAQGDYYTDLVNHYLLLTLKYGYIGAGLFLLVFMSSTFEIFRISRRFPNNSEYRTDCRALVITILALMTTLMTTSALGRVGLLLWILVGLSLVYTHLARREVSGRAHGIAGTPRKIQTLPTSNSRANEKPASSRYDLTAYPRIPN